MKQDSDITSQMCIIQHLKHLVQAFLIIFQCKVSNKSTTPILQYLHLTILTSSWMQQNYYLTEIQALRRHGLSLIQNYGEDRPLPLLVYSQLHHNIKKRLSTDALNQTFQLNCMHSYRFWVWFYTRTQVKCGVSPHKIWDITFDPLTTCLCYIRTQSVPRCKHSISVIQTKLLMLYKAKVAVCSENTQRE
jgi:hypothetical protein